MIINLIKNNKSDLAYNTVHNFHKYNDTKKFNKLSFESKEPFLSYFLSDLNRFINMKPRNGNKK